MTYTTHGFFIEGVNGSIRYSLCYYRAQSPEENLTNVAFQAEFIPSIEEGANKTSNANEGRRGTSKPSDWKNGNSRNTETK